MCFFEAMNNKVKKMDFIDVKLMQCAAFCIGIIVVKVFPQFFAAIRIRYLLFLIAFLVMRPYYKVWFKK